MRRLEQGDDVVRWWDSPAEMAEACAAQRVGFSRVMHAGVRWFGGRTWEENVRDAREGRTDLVPEAERMLEKVMAQVDSPRSEWVAARAGAYPVVPDALAGHPNCMRRRVEAQDDRAPIRIFVDLGSSAAVSPDDLRRRGVACLALAIALSAERPVELYAVDAGSRDNVGKPGAGVLQVIRVGTAPLDLATACNALTSVGFARDLCYGWDHVDGFYTGWAWNCPPDSFGSRARYVAQLRAAVGATENDIIIPGAALGDEAVSDPVKFVQRAIDDHRNKEEGQ